MSRAPRERKCRNPACRAVFAPTQPMQAVCSQQCALNVVRERAQAKAKTEARVRLLEGRRRMMTRSDSIKKAQKAFNRFVRARDKDRPCICCGQPLGGDAFTGGTFDAGHYRSTGSAPHLRFVEDNCHAQRKVCNQFGAGRAVDYRIGLIKRIGLARVEALESDQAERKYSIDDLKAMTLDYSKRARDLSKATAKPEVAA